MHPNLCPFFIRGLLISRLLPTLGAYSSLACTGILMGKRMFTYDSASHRDFWTDEARSSDPRWEEVCTRAKAVLVGFGWPIEIPSPAREEQGMLVDKGSYFLKSRPPSQKA
jgi:hypothetical protein